MTRHSHHTTTLVHEVEYGPGSPRDAWHERRQQLDRDGVDYKHNDSNLTIQHSQGPSVTIVEAYRKAEE